MIGVIADDLTGAAELGAIGLRYGLTAEVLLRDHPVSRASLVCVDTDSRSCSPEEASRRAASAAQRLVSAGASWFYKKVDSVLRGQIVAELGALMAGLRLPRALLVAANPSLGRVIQQGQYWVKGRPIHETEFRFDPEYPRRSADVLDLLGAGKTSVVHVCPTNDALPRTGIVVGEAASADDLQRWAQQIDASTIAAGGADFFGVLLGAKGFQSAPLAKPFTLPTPTTGLLFVCGSTSKACEDFLAASRRDGVPVICLPAELAEGKALSPAARDQLAVHICSAFPTQRRVVLATGLPLIHEPKHARSLAEHLAAVAEAVLARVAGVQVFVEGGATAVGLVRRLGWSRLTVLGEMAPGVATLRPEARPGDHLTLKPGSYAWPGRLQPAAAGEHPCQ